MKTKLPAQSAFFNSGFLIVLCVFLFAVFLFAAANSSGLDSGAFSNASAQSNLASQRPNTAQHKSGSRDIRSSRKDMRVPLGGECVTLRGPIVILSESADILGISTASAAFNSQQDESLISWDQLVGATWAVYDQRLAVDGSLLGENNPVIEGTDIIIEPAAAYNADTDHYFVTWRFQTNPGEPGFNNAFGRLVDASGIPAGDVVQVSNAGFEQTLVFNSVTGEFAHHAHATSTVAEFLESISGELPAMVHHSRRRHRSPPPERPLQQVTWE